jgi:hypothetical protein
MLARTTGARRFTEFSRCADLVNGEKTRRKDGVKSD